MINIEIRGVNFVNKGAQLMLEAVRQALTNNLGSNYNLCVQLGVGTKSQKRQNNLKSICRLDLNRKKLSSYNTVIIPVTSYVGNIFRKTGLLSNDYVTDYDIDIILDISGFAYGDQLGSKSSKILQLLSERWVEQNKNLILLPQAYGPFNNLEIASSFEKVIDNASLIFIRDETSYKHMTNTFGQNDKFFKCPDITIGLKINSSHSEDNLLNNKLVFIASERMLDKTVKNESNMYVTRSAELIRLFLQNGQKVAFLVHESGDFSVTEKIKVQVGDNKIPIIYESDPVKLKKMLGRSKLVISSRYHGLVNALSQNVPVIATGWSHKYQQLLTDYEYPINVVNIATEELTTIVEKYEYINLHKEKIVGNLDNKNKKFQNVIDTAWNNIFKIINYENTTF
jgi:polysaccharide pyruvyl transferase WcaK-like protein